MPSRVLIREDARATVRSALKALGEGRDDLAIAFLRRAAALLESLALPQEVQ